MHSEVESNKVEDYSAQLEQTLAQTEKEVLQASEGNAPAWTRARIIVEKLQPLPLFIWRLNNIVLGKPGLIGTVSDGMVFGLRRLMFAAASDDILGVGRKVNSVPKALEILPADVVAAISVLYAVCKKLANHPQERIWRPILEDAIIRAQIGHLVGSGDPSFGSGRGMLAGFAGRAGLVVQMASGEVEQARIALDRLAQGALIKEIGLQIYQCEPLQVSAMLLSAVGCGRDAAFGTVAYSGSSSKHVVENEEQQRWLSAFSIIENSRIGKMDRVTAQEWAGLGFEDPENIELVKQEARRLVRRGPSWVWLINPLQ